METHTCARQQQLTSIQHGHTAKAAHAEAVSDNDRNKKNTTVAHRYSSEKGNARDSAALEKMVLCPWLPFYEFEPIRDRRCVGALAHLVLRQNCQARQVDLVDCHGGVRELGLAKHPAAPDAAAVAVGGALAHTRKGLHSQPPSQSAVEAVAPAGIHRSSGVAAEEALPDGTCCAWVGHTGCTPCRAAAAVGRRRM